MGDFGKYTGSPTTTIYRIDLTPDYDVLYVRVREGGYFDIFADSECEDAIEYGLASAEAVERAIDEYIALGDEDGEDA